MNEKETSGMSEKMSEKMREMSEEMREVSEEMSEMSRRMNRMSEEMEETDGTGDDAGFIDDKGRRWHDIGTVYVIDAFALDDGLRNGFDEWLVTCRDEGYDFEQATRHVANELYNAVEDEYDNAVERLCDVYYQVIVDACMTHPAFLHIDWDGIARALLEDAGYGRHDEWTRAGDE